MNGGGITCQRQGNCRNSCHISPIRERQCIFGLTRSQSQIAGESLSHCRFAFILCRSFSLPFSQRGGCRLASQFPCLLELTCVDSGVRSVVIDEVFELLASLRAPSQPHHASKTEPGRGSREQTESRGCDSWPREQWIRLPQGD